MIAAGAIDLGAAFRRAATVHKRTFGNDRYRPKADRWRGSGLVRYSMLTACDCISVVLSSLHWHSDIGNSFRWSALVLKCPSMGEVFVPGT